MTDEEWVQQAIADLPPMSEWAEGKANRLALLFREANENVADHR
jgi:hypothetical protein